MFKQLISVLALTALAAVSAMPTWAAGDGVNWSSGVISVVGEGAPPAEGSPAKKRLLAKRAAIVDGYRKLAEAIQGVHVTSDTSVKELEVQSDEIRTSVNGLVKGALIVEENHMADGAYEVRIELPLFGGNSLASAVMMTSLNRRKTSTVTAPMPEIPAAPGEGANEAYTGVIIDARNLRAKAAMMPVLFDEGGRELYLGNLDISNDDLVAQGPASYANSLEEAKSHPRIGSKPLVVRAKRFKGPFQADLILGQSEADKLTFANQRSSFLKDMAVVIVR